jgi:hypothetical protein
VHHDTDRAEQVLEDEVRLAIGRLPARFSTKRLIDELRATPGGQAVYEEALGLCGGGGEWNEPAYRVLHGQAIAALLRNSDELRFAGFIHGLPQEDDGYSVPTWWQKTGSQK